MKKIFSGFLWDFPTKEKVVYLTFDDGPIPEITDWTLHLLKQYNAKATFFCIGDNISKSPELFKKVLSEGHAVGNHTYHHLNGWYFTPKKYLENVKKCEDIMQQFSEEVPQEVKLFRPPYGKVNRKQFKMLKESGYKLIMWDVLSADFDTKITPEQCLENVIKNIRPGSIIIFHDSIKASKNLMYALPQTLEYLKKNGYEMKAIRIAPEPN